MNSLRGEVKRDLSDRERQVLRLVKNGMRNREIAKTLGISENTTKRHVSSILLKIGMSSRTEAAIAAISHPELIARKR